MLFIGVICTVVYDLVLELFLGYWVVLRKSLDCGKRGFEFSCLFLNWRCLHIEQLQHKLYKLCLVRINNHINNINTHKYCWQ